MRALRCLAVGLLSVTGGLAVSIAAATPASAAPPFNASLTLDPTSGKASTTIAATFQIAVPDGVRCRMRVTFRWDDHTLGQKSTDACTLTVHIKAPRDGREQGSHQVRATETTSHIEATATFTVTDGDATPTATPTRAHTSPPADDPTAAFGPPVSSASVDPTAGQVLPQAKTSSSMFTPIALIFGGGLVLGGVAILTLVILRMRRGEPEPEPEFDDDFPTQTLYSTTRPIRFGQPAATATYPLEYRRPPEVPD